MHFTKGFNLAKKFYLLILIPIFLDLLQLADILRRVKDFNIKFTVPSAIPSLIEVLADLPFSYSESTVLALAIFFVVIGSFLKGVFLGCILSGVERNEVSMDVFMKYSREYFKRFLLQLFILLLFFLVIVPFALILGPLALILYIGIIVLGFYLVFWDYIIVVKNQTLLDAARDSLNLVSQNLGKVFSFVVLIILITALFSVIANFMVGTHLILAFLAIVIYGYLGTAIIFAIMSFYLELKREENEYSCCE